MHHRGFTLLIAVITASIVLAMGMSILNITLKEFMLSGVARESEMAFFAADAGMECVLYWDQALPTNGGKFNVGQPVPQPQCMGAAPKTSWVYEGTPIPTQVPSAATGTAQYEWTIPATAGSPAVTLCSRVSINKVTTGVNGCPAGVTCTTVVSSGFNRPCASVGTDPRTVERRLRTSY